MLHTNNMDDAILIRLVCLHHNSWFLFVHVQLNFDIIWNFFQLNQEALDLISLVILHSFSGMFSFLVVLSLIWSSADGVTRGRDAAEGEFPYIVRILVSEQAPDTINTRSLENNYLDNQVELNEGVENLPNPINDSMICSKERISRRKKIDWEKNKKRLMEEFKSNTASELA